MSSSRTLRSDSARSLRLSRSSSSRGSTRSLPVERPLPSLPEMRSQLQDEISKVPATDHMTLFVASQLAAVVEAFDKFEHQADAMNQLKETVVDEFSAFRVTFAKTNLVVFRMAFIRRMFERLTELLKALGEVVNNVNQETIVDRTTWEEKLGAARNQEETELSGIAKKSTMPFVRNVQGHEAMEALTLMKFEIDFYPPPRNSKLHVASMKSVFFSIVRSSNGRVSKIPDWYSPPYLAIKEMLPPIGDHFLSTSKRATWADRHQKGAVVPVVLKHTFLEADGIDLFRREVEIWASLNHPNVIKLLGASHCSSPTVLVLEDATRGSISDHVWQCANNQKMLWKLLHDAALGLQYLHSEPYNAVHGNIKPSNLLVSKDGIGKISDFGGGLATLQNRALQYEKFAEKSGEQGEAKYANYGDSVLRWRAPEYQSFKKRPTYQGDVYSFGMCILNAIDRNFIPPIGEIPPGDLENRLAGLSSAARELVVAMTVEDPMKRLTMDQVVEKLSELSESTR